MSAQPWPSHAIDDPSVSLPSRPRLVVIDGGGGAGDSGTFARVRSLRRWFPIWAIGFGVGFVVASITLSLWFGR